MNKNAEFQLMRTRNWNGPRVCGSRGKLGELLHIRGTFLVLHCTFTCPKMWTVHSAKRTKRLQWHEGGKQMRGEVCVWEVNLFRQWNAKQLALTLRVLHCSLIWSRRVLQTPSNWELVNSALVSSSLVLGLIDLSKEQEVSNKNTTNLREKTYFYSNSEKYLS